MAGIVSCSKPAPKSTEQNDSSAALERQGMATSSKPAPKSTEHGNSSHFKYENELFSIEIPKGWLCDISDWNGLDSMVNRVSIFDPYGGNVVWLYIVKTFFPIKWKNIDEAKRAAKTMVYLGGDREIIREVDGVEVGGYPASILYIAKYEDNDTIIQKQFVTYLQDSHIVMYFNEMFFAENWEYAQKLGDEIISTIKLKKGNSCKYPWLIFFSLCLYFLV